ncbi:hypothetical protein M3Y95_00074000 [Aphelenchoides besseyi]|nr:hypothetical protein M3Y95_00074000 [Aphelenchoides besseyi]
MNVHQVLTGALNDGDFTFSVGCIDGHKFIACAVGANVVILTSNFARIQVIHGSQFDVVRAVNCCNDTGKIAFSHDKDVRIFEPVAISNGKNFPYRWQEAQSIQSHMQVDCLEWVLEGLRLLVLSDCSLVLYQHRSLTSVVSSKDDGSVVIFNINEDRISHNEVYWETVWETQLSSKPKYVKFSPDCALFATCGENDRFVKIWYPNENNSRHGTYDFSFIYLQHPDVVFGFEWRRTGKYVPRKCVNNAIITWCADNTSRVWKQTPSINDTVEQLLNAVQVVQQDRNVCKKTPSKHATLKKARTRLISKISRLMHDKTSSPSTTQAKTINFGRSATFADFAIPVASHNVSFSLAATINAENDCFLVPSMDDRDSSMFCAFAVHWLNNKEFLFTYGAEKILAETLLNDHSEYGQRSGATSADLSSPVCGSTDGNAGTNVDSLTPTADPSVTALNLSPHSTAMDNVKDFFDVKIEGLVQHWNKSSDVLFSVHPVDGSLLTWTIEWLDDDWRQAVVSFASRFPNAFPLTDAASLSLSISVFSPHETTLGDLQRHFGEHTEHESAQTGNFIHLLTSHENGSLNLWQFCMEDNRQYSNILNIVHRYRMCGHRFKTSSVSAHPILPLLLTSSSFTNDSASKQVGESELILWKINPVGPLCKSGGVRELSRMTVKEPNIFYSISWLPAIIPSSALGTICNSPSSCFLTFKDGNLAIYQAIVDARNLLSELFASSSQQVCNSSASSGSEDETIDVGFPKRADKNAFKLTDMFDICSTQSTGKPGCIIYLGDVVDAKIGSDEVLLLHTFDEALALSDYGNEQNVGMDNEGNLSGRFFILLVQRSTNGTTMVRMWSLKISAQSPTPISGGETILSRSARSLGGPQFYASATSTAPRAARLRIETEKVYESPIDLPDGVEVKSVSVSAGHLSSASVYPACRTPYFLLLSCSDSTVRFLRCVRSDSNSDQYIWEMWKMIGAQTDSSLDICGEIAALASAHSGRFACAFLPLATTTELSPEALVSNINIAVYECESSGGVEWLQEEHLKLGRCFGDRNFLNSIICDSIVNMPIERQHPRHRRTLSTSHSNLVRLDWASTEDGTHILTVGVANLIFFFAQMSQSTAQQNVAIMAEEQQTRRPTLRRNSSIAANIAKTTSSLVRWVCIRYLDLESVDGLAPLPTVLSWARDGLLVIGMPSEMRVYSQWNLKAVQNTPKVEHTNKPPVQKFIKVMGIRPVASASTLSTSRSQMMLDQVLKLSVHKGPGDVKMENKTDKEVPTTQQTNQNSGEEIMRIMMDEGIFEASRLANPILPQYHPQQLIKMLNAGKTKRVKAILLHVLRALRQHQVAMRNPLSRAASVRRFNNSTNTEDGLGESQTGGGMNKQRSVLEDDDLEYQELDGIPPLPLYVLMEMDKSGTGNEKPANIGDTSDAYDSLFKSGDSEDELDEVLDSLQKADSHSRTSRSRHSSTCSDSHHIANAFTSRHNQALTELLTHIHLPGLSSVDQMHLLAVANTLSHFSSNLMDKLVQANASFQTHRPTALVDTTASGYATSGGLGIETVDECGLRFLMAMKQHEYLLRYLPHVQKQRLKLRGMSLSQIIWAFHSDAETELLNALPCCQKGEENWEDLRAYGIAWWVRNTTTLRLCIEKVAKSAFQASQDPMDAALYYLAMRKKNVLTHLFKTVGNQRMYDFFREDFNEERPKKTALKNAFVLMSKQRFQNAAAFFLLGNSLQDAIQIILMRMKDLQLAMVVLRLYVTDHDKQVALMEELLCKQVFGSTAAEVHEIGKKEKDCALSLLPDASRNPFERSMALWMSKEYLMAAETLVDEAAREHVSSTISTNEPSLPDIFSFYAFLRRNPLVMRQRLTNAGIQVASTEKFLAYARDLENRVTPNERCLYFRTASAHLTSGCPLLALDVLSMLPRRLCTTVASAFETKNTVEVNEPKAQVEDTDWSAPTEIKSDELELKWSDDEASDEEQSEKEEPKEEPEEKTIPSTEIIEKPTESPTSLDFISQHMKFVAALKMMTDELSTLASGVEVDGGQLRVELLEWLERECTTLKEICEYRVDETKDDSNEVVDANDKTDILNSLRRRRQWLLGNQKLIRTFTSYCILHSAQNHRLTSVLMELILLLLEIQQEANGFEVTNSLQTKAFPLFVASISMGRMFVSSPLNFIEDQCTDLLLTISQILQPPPFGTSLASVKKMYNLCQGLSSCLYQALSCLDDVNRSDRTRGGVLTTRLRTQSFTTDELNVRSEPNNWPGVESLIALLSLGRDEEAPNLRLLLVKVFFSVAVSLFCYALSVYDSRWLYRLCARNVDSVAYGQIFGGAGEKYIRQQRHAPPSRPPPPSSKPLQPSAAAAHNLRANLHAKVFGPEETRNRHPSEQKVSCWIPPKKHIVQFYAEKVENGPNNNTSGTDFNSDDSESDLSDDEENFDVNQEIRPHKDPNSYAWLLMRFAAVAQESENLKRFLRVAGFEISELVSLCPQVDGIIKLLNNWSVQLQSQLENFPDGCPISFLPSMYITNEQIPYSSSTSNRPSTPPLLRKYRSLIEHNNTPFEYTSRGVLSVKRLWLFLVRQENLSHFFVRHIFAKEQQNETRDTTGPATKSTSSQSTNEHLTESIRIVQKEREGILSFACNNSRPGWIVLSTNREIQEINLERVFEEKENVNGLKTSPNFFNSRVDLDIALDQMPKDKLKDNDDYQLLCNNSRTKAQGSSFLTAFIVDRSRVALKKLQKRSVSGVRRLESHPNLPYYISGATDGSILLWEWNADQPLFTARVAGQFAKVTKLTFAVNGNKFASVDGDGHLCIWQATQQMTTRKPFFNQKCHTKSAADVKFLGQTSSVLVTAGQSQGDLNIALWDTLLPQNRSLVYSFSGHIDGATCVTYFPGTQTIVSGGRHGEVCVWDLRQRQLRSTIKAYDSAAVRCMYANPASNILVTGSSEGDVKIWDTGVIPQLLHTLPGEHSVRGGFSLRQVGSSSQQGVQQVYCDQEMRLYSCGADCSLKIRNLPTY